MTKYSNLLRLLLIVFLSIFFSFPSYSQKTERIQYSAEGSLEGGERNGERVKILMQGVVFKQKNTTIHADSAYFYEQRNALEAFGKVKILEGDSITITGKNLLYDGDLKVAKMRGNVVYKDPTSTLTTQFLDYDMIAKLAKYYEGGKLVDPENTLTSKKGYYDTNARFVSFKEDVVLKNVEYTLKSDTLQYNTVSKVALVRGPTHIITKDKTELTMIEGEFHTLEKRSTFSKGQIMTENYILTGDILKGDDLNQFYSASQNVRMVSLKDEVVIMGNEGRYSKKNGITEVYGNAIMKKAVNLDTMYLSSDSLVSIEKPGTNNKKILAYHDVKIFKSDLQGKSDSLVYDFSDSTIYLYNSPVLWSDGNQISADSINIQMANNKIDRMNMSSNSFVISEDTAKNYNQIKGRDMVAFFNESKIDRVNVYGNGESIYFVLEQALTVGMNKALCSNMLIKFKEAQAHKITFYANPDASFVPPHEMKEPDKKLQGFVWHSEKRPDFKEVLKPRDSTLTKPVENNPAGIQHVSQEIKQNAGTQSGAKPTEKTVAKPVKEEAKVTNTKPSAIPANNSEKKPISKPVQRSLSDPSKKEAIRKAPMVKD
ncbi:MAG: Organic solvent tolerance protein OstA [Bacteroidota bacterium]|nr:Organic solvent tolerance protein OstA [Bacteroidota bacterium]